MKEFIELSVNTDTMRKNVKLGELHTKCATEYVDDWEKFNKTSLPEKEDFYNHLNMEDITDADYAHKKRLC